jgi:hypothetical protein
MLKISLKVSDFFTKGHQLVLPKMGQIMFLIRWCNLTEFSFMRESFILKYQILKMGYQAGGL